ncbi:MAG: hypothetical protein WBN99_09365 [Mycobacterium sp.]
MAAQSLAAAAATVDRSRLRHRLGGLVLVTLLRLLRSKERLKDERERAERRWAIVHMSASLGSPG